MAGIPRVIEILLAVVGLIVLCPLLIIIAVLIKLTSAGPFLFCQRRIGQHGKEFTLYKFRTMKVENEGPLITASTDQRITRLGRILRQTKLDELPELWNILKGDMSFVGPRPEVPLMVDFDNAVWQEILSVRPGLTDPVTLRLRNEEKLLTQVEDKEEFYRNILQPYKLRGYAHFVRKKSLVTDIKIIFQTLRAVIQPNSMPPTIEELRGDFKVNNAETF